MTLEEFLKIGLPTLLGGSGWLAFFVRARVYLVHRRSLTVPVIETERRQQVEAALRSHGIPLCYFEVEWWNRGTRSAKEIAVEVTSDARVMSWELFPGKGDFSAPWTCELDPLAGGEPSRIRIRQPYLHPQARSRLVLGFDSPPPVGSLTVRGLVGDAPLSAPSQARRIYSLSSFAVAIALVFGGIEVWRGYGGGRLGLMPSWVFVVLTVASIVASKLTLGRFSPGKPSWEER
jgi:hypothetical protein